MSQTPSGSRPSNPSLAFRPETPAPREHAMQRNQQSPGGLADYDALADLFLGEGGPAIASTPGVPVPTAHGVSSGAMPALKLAGGSGAGLKFPDETREEPPPPKRTIKAPTGFEALALGHLPVMASAWAMQYARSVATLRQEPVAVLRVGSGRVSLEVVGEQTTTSTGAFDTLADGVRAAAMITDAWMLRVDEPTETELSGIEGVAGITLLTGADEVAIVNSYRAIKGYLENGLISRAGEEDGPKVALRLAVMGAPEDRAKEAAERIRKAASTYLGCVIDSVICSPKISPAATRTMFRADSSEPVKSVVAEVIRAWGLGPMPVPAPVEAAAPQPVAAAPVPSVVAATEPKKPAVEPAPVATVPSGAHDAMDDLIDVPNAPAGVAQDAASDRFIEPIAPRKPEPTPVFEAGASHSRIGPRGGAESTPLSHQLPGLTALNVRCPFAPSAELAASSDGTLHVLGLAGGSGDAPRVVEAIVAAASWAEVHAEILRQIRPGLRAGQVRPVLHVFTDRAKDVRPLIDSEIRLHAVVRGASGVGVADLN